MRIENEAGGIIARYYYDPFGRRLWKDAGGKRTYFHYSNDGLVGEYDEHGAVVKTYGYMPGSPWTTAPLFMKVDSRYYYYHNDHLGTPQKITAQNGEVVWSAEYLSFGRANIDKAGVINNLRFAGQYYDQETGLHYNFHRYYDPTLGRYLRADPIGLAGGINLYTYALNNPVNFLDPNGEFAYAPVILLVLKGYGVLEAVDVVVEKYYETQVFDFSEQQRRFLLKQLNETDPDDLRREKILMDAYNKLVLQQVAMGWKAGVDIMEEFTNRSFDVCE